VRSDRERLLDIHEAIEKIQQRLPADAAEAFRRDEMLQVWALHHVQLIGEAAARLSDALRAEHPAIPWPDIIAMRNVLVHQYFSADLDQVWHTIVADLPSLKAWVQKVLADVDE
jgi:uncharacterized protein with HEPN domain